MVPDEFEKSSKLSFYHWYRLANDFADNYAYLVCGSVKSSVDAVLKMVLNSIVLAEQVDVKEFISQASDINILDDMVSNYTKADESFLWKAFHKKDSDVVFHLAKKSGVKFQAVHNHTTVDAPETVRYVRSKRGVDISYPPMSMWELIVKHKTPPTRRMRYCCEELKEYSGAGKR
ncbi:MAG: hypothetical protein K2L86_03565 [Lachnospiraceae bacterium]|nr:hypothetical protein [Lachnospiraceae bacterium]